MCGVCARVIYGFIYLDLLGRELPQGPELDVNRCCFICSSRSASGREAADGLTSYRVGKLFPKVNRDLCYCLFVHFSLFLKKTFGKLCLGLCMGFVSLLGWTSCATTWFGATVHTGPITLYQYLSY